MTGKTWEEMTREERVNLLLSDSDAYIQLVPPDYWTLLLDGMSGLGPVEPD